MRQSKQAATKLWNKRQKLTRIDAAPHNDEPALTPAQQLGRLGGAARARSLTAEQRREIAQNAAAKRWALASSTGAGNLPPSGQGDDVTDGTDFADELIMRNRHLLAQAREERLRARQAAATAKQVVHRAMQGETSARGPSNVLSTEGAARPTEAD